MCSTPSFNDDYAEVMASIRHYSTLRFAMLTVFVAISGGLLSVLYSDTAPAPLIRLAPLLGVAAALIFGWLEITLDKYLSAFGKVADALKPDGHWRQRPHKAVQRTYIPLRGMYVVSLLMWSWLAVGATPS